jgi:hypothetical protein
VFHAAKEKKGQQVIPKLAGTWQQRSKMTQQLQE